MAAGCRDWNNPEVFDIGDAAFDVVVSGSESGETLAAAWIEVEDRGDGNGILSRIFARALGENGAPTIWLSEGQNDNAIYPRIAVTREGNAALVAWRERVRSTTPTGSSSFNRVRAALWDGSVWTTSTLSIDSEGAVFPQVTFLSGDAPFVVWKRNVRLTANGAEEPIWEQRLEAATWDGEEWSFQEIPTSEGIDGDPLLVASEAGGAAIIAWEKRWTDPEFPLGLGEVHLARLTAGEVQLGPTSGARENLHLKSLEASAESNSVAVLWTQLDRDPGGDHDQLYAGTGTVDSWLPARLSNFDSVVLSESSAAVSEDGSTVRVAWSQREPRPSDGEPILRGHTASWDGSNWTDEILSSEDQTLYESPRLALAADGSFAMVVWEDVATQAIFCASGTTNAWALSTAALVPDPSWYDIGIGTIKLARDGKSAVLSYNTRDFDADKQTINTSLWNGARWQSTSIDRVTARLEMAWVNEGAEGTWLWIERNSTEIETLTFARLR
jgi:hypothetical protein